MPAKNDEEEEYPWGNEEQGVEEGQRDSIGENLDNESVRDRLPRRTPQDGLFASESTSSLREVRFSE